MNVNKNNVNRELLFFSERGNLDCVKMCLEQGADLECTDGLFKTPLLTAAWFGHLHIVKYLIEIGANPELKDKSNRTALDLAKQYEEAGKNKGISEFIAAYINSKNEQSKLDTIVKANGSIFSSISF